MAKRKKTIDLLGLLAFIALAISTICYLLSALDIHVGGVLPLISSACLLIVVLLAAWNYASRLSKGWRFFYLILAVASITCFILGQYVLM